MTRASTVEALSESELRQLAGQEQQIHQRLLYLNEMLRGMVGDRGLAIVASSETDTAGRAFRANSF